MAGSICRLILPDQPAVAGSISGGMPPLDWAVSAASAGRRNAAAEAMPASAVTNDRQKRFFGISRSFSILGETAGGTGGANFRDASHGRQVAVLIAAGIIHQPHIVAPRVNKTRLPVSGVVSGIVDRHHVLKLASNFAHAFRRHQPIAMR